MLWFNPSLPKKLKQVQFNIRYRGHWITVKVTEDLLRVCSRKQNIAPIKIGFREEVFDLKAGDWMEFKLDDQT